MKKILAVCFGLCGVSMLSAQEEPDYTTLKAQLKQEILRELDQRDSLVKALSPSPLSKDRFSFSGYGAVNYYKYGTYDSDPYLKGWGIVLSPSCPCGLVPAGSPA